MMSNTRYWKLDSENKKYRYYVRYRTDSGCLLQLSLQEADPCQTITGDTIMLEIIAIVLIVLWVLGLVSSTSMGGFIHILLVIALIVILVRVIQGRR